MIIFVSFSSVIFKSLQHKVLCASPEIHERFFNHQDLGFYFVFDPISSDSSIKHLWKYIKIARLFIFCFFIFLLSVIFVVTFISISFDNINFYIFIYIIFLMFLGAKIIKREKLINKNLIFYLSDSLGIIILICFAIHLFLNPFYYGNSLSILYIFILSFVFFKKLFNKKSSRKIINNSAIVWWIFMGFIIVFHITSIFYLIRYTYIIKNYDYNLFLIITLGCLVFFFLILELILVPFIQEKKYFSAEFLKENYIKFYIAYPFIKITRLFIRKELEPAQIITLENEINNRIYFAVSVYLPEDLEIILTQSYYYRHCEEICNQFNKFLYEDSSDSFKFLEQYDKRQ